MVLIRQFLLKILQRFFISISPKAIACVLRVFIRMRLSNGKDTLWYRNRSNKLTILALDSERYRGDLSVLAHSGQLRVLHIREGWQNILIQGFFSEKYYVHDIVNARLGSRLYEEHLAAQAHVAKVLEWLYKLVTVDAVTTVHFKYLSDYYWTDASEKSNIPYILLHRECNLMSPIIFDMVKNMMEKQGYFHGSHVVVHNQKAKEVFIQSKFFDARKITVASALRMDDLIKSINNYSSVDYKHKIKKRRKRFILFYFPFNSVSFGTTRTDIDLGGYGLDEGIWDKSKELFTELHHTILRLAESNTDVDFVIKPKKVFMKGGEWDFFKEVVSSSGIEVEALDNYVVDADLDVHELIKHSDIICGLQSSTTIESAILGKRVVFPFFNNYMKTAYFRQFPWREYLQLFDVALSCKEFEVIFSDALENPSVSDSIMKQRKELYLECFDDLSGSAERNYIKVIVKTINRK